MTKSELHSLQVGDSIVCHIGNGVGDAVGIRVTKITETTIECDSLVFDRNTGGVSEGWHIVSRLEDHGRDTTY